MKTKDWVENNSIFEIVKKKVDSNIILEAKFASIIYDEEDDNDSDDNNLERNE